MKACFVCKIKKPINQFYKAIKGCRRGLTSYCKPCSIRASRKWALKNPDQVRENLARWQKENRDRVRELARRWKVKNPATKDEMNRLQKNWRRNNLKRAKANQVLQYAVKNGKIEKPNICEDCDKNIPRDILHGHHEDYSKPLEVNWLCPPCHGDRHMGVLK